MRLSVSGFGLPLPLTVNGRGTSALDAAKMDMTFDLGPIMRLGGIQGDGRTRVVVLGKDFFVRPPAIEGFAPPEGRRSEEHTSELQSRQYLVCRLLLEKKKKK